MTLRKNLLTYFCAAGIGLATLGGCETMKEHPRTTGTIGGAALGAGAGALIDRNKPGRGAIIGGVVGGVAGNVGGAVYKDNQEKERRERYDRDRYDRDRYDDRYRDRDRYRD